MLERPHITDVDPGSGAARKHRKSRKYLFYSLALLALGWSQLNAAPAQATPIQAPAHTEVINEGVLDRPLPESATWADGPAKARPGQPVLGRTPAGSVDSAENHDTRAELRIGERADDV